MKKLHMLKDSDFISIAKLIDNNFMGNKNIIVHERKLGIVRVTGRTDGGQCINCDVKIDIYLDKLRGVFIDHGDGYRHVYPPTLKKVIDYLSLNNFDYCNKK